MLEAMKRVLTLVTALIVALVVVPVPANASAAPPTGFPLPNNFQPEGIAIGARPYAYLGSRLDGSIYRADLRTGQGSIISRGPGTQSLGMKVDDRGRLFVAGGNAGDARVIDTRTGAVLASYQLTTTKPAFVNDVILTGDAAWFTDSNNAFLYQLPLGRHGRLPGPDGVVRVPLTGDIVYGAGTNANGIATTPDGCALLIVQSNTGKLFRVDPRTGVTREVGLGGYPLTNGDGLLRSGRTLYAVLNRLNKVAVLKLDRAGTSGTLTGERTNPLFDIPTTAAAYGDRLYLPNARFVTPPGPDTTYSVNTVSR